MTNLRAVEDQESQRLVDEDRPALPPSLPYEPGHEDARSCGRERIKRYLRRNERF